MEWKGESLTACSYSFLKYGAIQKYTVYAHLVLLKQKSIATEESGNIFCLGLFISKQDL